MGEQFNEKAYLVRLQGRLTNIVVDDTHLTIKVNDQFDYDIALDRIDSPVKILQWVIHLTEKSWMTTELVSQFVQAACTRAGVDPHFLPA